MKKYIIILLILLSLSSCFSDETNITEDKDTNNSLNDKLKRKIIKDSTVEETKNEIKIIDGNLKIGEDVLIKKGRSEDFPKEIPVIKSGEIYQNSNMNQYAFIVVEDNNLKEIHDYYNSEMKKLGWEKENFNDFEGLDDLPKDEIENDFLEDLIFINKKGDKELNIIINDSVPEIIKDNLELEGAYIEFIFTDIYIEENEK